ncbi:hypothetical protein L6164_015439 [Bauhinia variegata]|uniref:Uncharacterized protein n=1 Tax=Bauhinia variegata TaxID=167791 RepID=A0ACB9NKM4_BAUVA|nr:hypothetical protein L6164_015439 [Bauhinia variegata]
MGGSHSQLEISDSAEEEKAYEDGEEEETNYEDAEEDEEEKRQRSSERRIGTPSSLDDVEAMLKPLKLKYTSSQNPNLKNAVQLYLNVGGNTPKAKWVTSEKLTSYSFVRTCSRTVCLRTHGIEATDENKLKVYGKDFIGWANPETADDSMREDAQDHFVRSPGSATLVRSNQDLREEFEEAANSGLQSLALGALDNSFLMGDSGIQNRSSSLVHSTPKKALLMRAETNMLLMSPMDTTSKPHSTGLHQLDIETGKIVTEWKFVKDGTEITMRDIINDSKGAQLDPSGSTFLGLDDNRICRWDMRDRNGIV